MDISREGTYYLKLGSFKPGCTRIIDIALSYWSDDLVVVLLQPVKELHISRFAFLVRSFVNCLGHLSSSKLIASDHIILRDVL